MKTTVIVLNEGDVERVTVEMGVDEAAFLAKLIGGMTGPSSEQVMPGGKAIGEQIYESLVGSIFNRFFDDGVDEYLRRRG